MTDHHRWSDADLAEFHQEFRELKERFSEHEKIEGEMYAKISEIADAVNANTLSNIELKESMSGFPELWTEIVGTGRLMARLRKIGMTLGAVSVVGIALKWAWEWMFDL